MSRGPSQATLLVELASDAELFHTSDDGAYATLDGKTLQLKERAFRNLLSYRFFVEHGKTPHSGAVQSALDVLTGQALFVGPLLPVFTRIAAYQNKIYIDLCTDKWDVIEITAQGWQVIPKAPIKFRRPRGMLSLPYPEQGGKIDDLKPFINFDSDREFILIVSWLVAAISPKGPYTILALHGEHGSAKSTVARVLRSLLDPHKVPLRSEPRESRDLMIAATNGWCLAFDNLSYIRNQLSDDLCRLATGGGFTTRELYTDKEEALFEAQRPVLINGIEEVASRPDLLDRLLIIYLPRIPDEKRRPERSFWQEFEKARPQLLGVLCDAASTALRNLGKTGVTALPRMADYTEWVIAAETAFGWTPGTFLSAYKQNRFNLNELSLEGSLLAQPIRELVERYGAWEGTATDLFELLPEFIDQDTRKERSWPKNPKVLSGHLRRITPNLRGIGIEVNFWKSGERKIKIQPVGTGALDASDAEKSDKSESTKTDISTEEIQTLFNPKGGVHSND